MGLLRTAFWLAVGAVAVQVLPEFLKSARKVEIHGNVDPQFQGVKAAFEENFARGGEKEGAGVAVWKDGRLVAELWGGTADASAGRPWVRDTTTTVFSSTKAVCALVAAMLADRGLLDFDKLVTDYWPEFGQHGKGNVTVTQFLSHRAGLAAVDEVITKEDGRDWKALGKKMAASKPNWPPGTAWGYHGLTYGWVVDQLLRRVDPKQRSIGQFIKEEILKDHPDLTFHLGLPYSEFHHVARMYPPTGMETLKKMTNIRLLALQMRLMSAGKDSLMARAFNNPPWFGLAAGGLPTNNPEILNIECGAASGVGTAKGLSGIFNLLLQEKLMSRGSATFKRMLHSEYPAEEDKVLGMPIAMSNGFMYTKSPKGTQQFGHPGYGGQNVKVDVEKGLAFAYITNGLTPDMGDDALNFAHIQRAIYDCL